MKIRFRKLTAVILTAAMALIPAASSLAADEWSFAYPPDPYQTGWDNGIYGIYGLASPSNMLQGFMPGGIPGADQAEGAGAWGNPGAGQGGVPDGTGQPEDTWPWGNPADMGMYPGYAFGGSEGQEPGLPADAVWEGEAEDEYETAAETDDETSEESAETEDIEDEGGYFAKLLLYDIKDKTPSEELFAGYIDSLFLGEPVSSLYFEYLRNLLSDDEVYFYDALKDFISEIAAGYENYPIFDAEDAAPAVRLSKARLGLPDDVSNDEWYEAAMNYYMENVIDVNEIIGDIYLEDPFYFYWTDRSYVLSFSAYIDDDDCVIRIPYIYFPVGEDYEGSYAGGLGEYIIYTVANDEIRRARYAAANAWEIVWEHTGETDQEKLASFADEIIALTAEGVDHAASGEPGEDPWQAVYVFDDDIATEAAPEGFAKAFGYLCEMGGLLSNAAGGGIG